MPHASHSRGLLHISEAPERTPSLAARRDHINCIAGRKVDKSQAEGGRAHAVVRLRLHRHSPLHRLTNISLRFRVPVQSKHEKTIPGAKMILPSARGPSCKSARRVTLPVRRRRRIAAALLLRRAQELVLCVKRIAANGVALAAARAILPLVAWRADIEEPHASSGEQLCVVGVFAAG